MAAFPSLGRFFFYLIGILTDGGSGNLISILAKRPWHSSQRIYVCVVCIQGAGWGMHVSFFPLLDCNPNYLNQDYYRYLCLSLSI